MTEIKKTTEEKITELRNHYTQSLAERFTELNQAYMAMIDSNCAEENIRDLESISHTFCGSAGTFGFGDIAGLCRRIEGLCHKLLKGSTNLKTMNEISTTLGQLEDAILRPRLIDETQLMEISEPNDVKCTSRLIYFLDDDSNIVRLLKNKIETYGYEVRTFQLLDQFLLAIEQELPEVIIIDIALNEDASVAALRDCYDRLPIHIPSIVISEEHSFDVRLKAVKAGADAFLAKPLDISDVVDTLDMLVGDKNTEPYKILIVDDVKSMLDYYRIILERAGMECATLSDPAVIMQTLIEFDPELILMDLHMPQCRGDELAKLIHQEKKYAGLPIIYLSAEADMKEQLAALQMAGDGFLTKPIRPSHLVSAISVRAKRYRRIKSFMHNDGLTGLLNHSSLKRALERECARSSRSKEAFCFAMLDIDHFKSINDRYGHAAGDMVLKNLAWLLKQRMRISDVVGRYGGEEFGIIMPNTSLQNGWKKVNELLQVVKEIDIKLNNDMIHITFSGGVAAYPNFQNADDLCEAADKLLYEAKSSGRNKVLIDATQQSDSEPSN